MAVCLKNHCQTNKLVWGKGETICNYAWSFFSDDFIGKFLLKQLFGNGLSKPETEEAIT